MTLFGKKSEESLRFILLNKPKGILGGKKATLLFLNQPAVPTLYFSTARVEFSLRGRAER